MLKRWLAIAGIGEDGRAGLTAAAQTLIDSAVLVVGGKRHLDLIGEVKGERRAWATPLDATIPDILARRGEPVAILASGDPFWFGAATTLARSISHDEMIVIPVPSCFSLAAARLGWALQDTVTLGLNMKGYVPLIRRHLHNQRRILALSLNGETPKDVAALVTAAGFGPSRLTVLEALGGHRETIRETTAERFELQGINPLNMIALDVEAGPNARSVPVACGLDDSFFETDGQLTKREIRAVTLSSLAPEPGQRLWDVGLGSGSIAIEWLLSHASNKAIGIEQNDERASCAARNAIALGVPGLHIVRGEAGTSLAGLPAPDAVFIGGGASADIIDTCFTALKPGGRIVANAVTLETEALLIASYERYGGSLTRISVERADTVGRRTAWRPAMPVLQWVIRKSSGGA